MSARSAPCTGLVPADQNPPSSFRSQLPEILSRAGKAAFFCSDRSLKQPRNRAEYAHALRFELLGVDPHTRSAAPWLTESRKESHLRILVATTARVQQPGKRRARRRRVATIASPHLATVDPRRGGRNIAVLAPRRMIKMNDRVSVPGCDGVIEGQVTNMAPVAKRPPLPKSRTGRPPRSSVGRDVRSGA